MRRMMIALMMAALLLVPATSASGVECPALSGGAKLDFGSSLEGKAKLVYDGEKIKVDFVETSFVENPDGTFTVGFDWFFPAGTVSIVETSTVTPLVGPLVAFDSTIEVTSGGSGAWTWSGTSNGVAGKANIETIDGTLCVDG